MICLHDPGTLAYMQCVHVQCTCIQKYMNSIARLAKVLKSLFLYYVLHYLQDLGSKTLPELLTLWETLTQQTQIRLKYVHSLDSRLSSLESERANSIADVLLDYAHQLTLIAYLLPCDVERVIEVEANEINTALLDNSTAYTRLCLHLSTGEQRLLVSNVY